MKINKKWVFILGLAIALGCAGGAVYLLAIGDIGFGLAAVLEFFLFGIALILLSTSYEATYDIYNHPDERSQLIRMRAGSATLWTVSIVIQVVALAARRMLEAPAADYVMIALFGVFALIWLVYAIALVYYDRCT